MSLRVLHLINGMGTGGSERSLAEMLPLLGRLGIDSRIVCFYRRDAGVEQELKGRGVELEFLGARRTVPRVAALRQMLRRDEPHLVHTTHFEADLVGRLATARTGVPVLGSLVSTPYVEARFQDPRVNSAKLAAVRAIDSWTARHLGTHFHAVSRVAKSEAVRHLRLPAERISVIERGRDPERMGQPSPERRRRSRDMLGLPEDATVLVNVGRHDFAKGQRYLLAALARLERTEEPPLLLIAGREGAVSSELQRLVRRYGLGSRVRFLGHRDDVPDILAAADVFVFPSLYEGAPGAVIEAMALGLPIVASRIPGVVEIVQEGQNAVLFPPGDVEGLAEAIGPFLQRPDLGVELGGRGRTLFTERFTLQRSARRMAELFRAVGRRPRRCGVGTSRGL